MESDEPYDPDNEEPEEVPFNSFALENAVRRNMSIWRSHGMTGARQKYSATDDEEEDDDGDDDEDNSHVDAADDDDDEDWCCDNPSATGCCTFLYCRWFI